MCFLMVVQCFSCVLFVAWVLVEFYPSGRCLNRVSMKKLVKLPPLLLGGEGVGTGTSTGGGGGRAGRST